MQQHKGQQYVGVDGCILQHDGMNESGTGIRKEDARVGLVWVSIVTTDNPNHCKIGDEQQEKGGVDFPAPPKSARCYHCPTLLPQCAAISDHAGVTGHEHKDFAGVAEAVVAWR